MTKKHRVTARFWATICILLFLFQSMTCTVKAATVYVSDGKEYEEGYIIVGESHIVLTADAYSQVTDEQGNVPGLKGVTYFYDTDGSVSVTEEGYDNTFIMSGNLFFVFEGNRPIDGETQYSKEYIYSDGKGNRGIAVEKIHEIMEKNPNIKHWNIISFQGAVSCLEGKEAGLYYARSYENWINVEFPEANCFFVSHATMTKYYKRNKAVADEFDAVLASRFFGRYFDCTEFFTSRYPQCMRDPNEKPDTIHWSYETYVELFNKIIGRIQECQSHKCAFIGEPVE